MKVNQFSDSIHLGFAVLGGVLFSIIVLILVALLGLLLHAAFIYVFNRWNRQKGIRLNGLKLRLEYLRAPVGALIPAVCLISILPFLKFSRVTIDIIDHILSLWIIGSISWTFVRVIYIVRDLVLSHYDINVKDNLRARRIYTQIKVVERIAVVVTILITIAIMLMTFGKVRQIGVSLLASAGVIGIILGFAAQKTLGNLMAGIQIAIAQPIRLEDAVVVENEWGWIEEITLTYVVIRIWDLRRLIVPISYFIEKPFQNWTRTSARLLGSVFIYVDYTIPFQKLREELTRILEQSAYWDKEVNVLQVTNATEHTVEMRALMSAVDSPTTWNLRCEVREKLIEFLQKSFPGSLPRTRVELDKL